MNKRTGLFVSCIACNAAYNGFSADCTKVVAELTKDTTVDVRKSERATNNSCCCVSESVITHCSPDAFVIHFNTSFV